MAIDAEEILMNEKRLGHMYIKETYEMNKL